MAALALILLAGGCATRDAGAPLTFERPETALDYEVALSGAPTPEIDALLRQSLATFRRQPDGAQSPAFLRRRAQEDAAVAQRVLRSFGYFQATLTQEVAPPDAPGAPARVTLTLDPGPAFTLAAHRFVVIDDGGTAVAALDARALGSPVGATAAAAPILAAESAAVEGLRNDGRPYAETRARDAVADLAGHTLEVESTVAAGPRYVFGEPQFSGLERVDPEYLRTWTTWTPGEPFDARKVAAYQRALIDTGLFNAGSARPPETPPAGAALPVEVRLEEGPARTVSAGARFSTDTGPAVRGAFEHRNLFGANETVRLDALAGLEEQQFSARYREPQFLRPGQDFLSGFNLRHIEDDAFDETAATVSAGLERRLSPTLIVGAGGLLEWTDVKDSDGRRTFYLAGLPMYGAYDGSDDLLNPTEGARLRLDVTPFTGAEQGGGTPLFTRADGVGTAYYAVDAARRYVLAGRARAGVVVAEAAEDVPASRRLYSGGGGSVRGYAERAIGPLDADGDPTGGLSVLELGAEVRAQVRDPFGVALFVEAGAVSEEVYPTFADGAQTAAGLGLRYLSPVGPIRLDAGFPLNPRDEDDAFQVYVSIGQAW